MSIKTLKHITLLAAVLTLAVCSVSPNLRAAEDSTCAVSVKTGALVKLEADYILSCQYLSLSDPASGAINNVYGAPTWVVPRENALAILGLERTATCLNKSLYRTRAQQAMNYLVRVQQPDGSWYDQYSYLTPVVLSKSPTQAAEVMIAMNKLGFQANRYKAMIKGADFLLTLADPANKTGADDGLICGGLDANGNYQTWRWTSDNAFGYQALLAAARWAGIKGDLVRQQLYANAAARILDGTNLYLKDPNSAVWHVVVDANDVPIVTPHEWINYAPEMLDMPTKQARKAAIGQWIHDTLVNQPTGAAIWNDGTESDRLSPGYSFQASFVWQDLGQLNWKNIAWTWAEGSGLHQIVPDGNGIKGGWIDWVELGGAQAQWWERFIDTSFYAIASATGGYNFSPE